MLHLGGGSRSGTAPGPPHLLELHSNFCKRFNDDCDENILKKEQERMADAKLSKQKRNKIHFKMIYISDRFKRTRFSVP